MSNRELFRARRLKVEARNEQARDKNTPVLNPVTKLPSFGVFPGFKSTHVEFPEAPIYLRWGEHRGPHKGYGLSHIIQERGFKSTPEKDCELIGAERVLSVLKVGALIYYSEEQRRTDRTSVVCRVPTGGTVILELRMDGNNQPYYSIVTYIAQAQMIGSLVGRMPRLPSVDTSLSDESGI